MGAWYDLMNRLSDKLPTWVTPRYRKLHYLDLTLSCHQYDHLEYEFTDETVNGNYIPINDRRPSIIYPLPAILVKNLANKLFSGRHWPHPNSLNKDLVKSIESLTEGTDLETIMVNAVVNGSVGSIAISFAFVEGIPVFFTWKGKNCEPIFDNLGNLIELRIKQRLSYDSLIAMGYTFSDDVSPDSYLWYARKLTATSDIMYVPSKDVDPPDWNDWKIDKDRSFDHNFGFVPAVWIQNLPGGDFPDGDCTFKEALDFLPEIDYELSQIGRGYRYTAAPQLVIIGGSSFNIGPNQKSIARSPANIIELDPGDKNRARGDAKLLEMTGSGLNSGMDYVKLLRAYALEAVFGSRKDPERLTAIPMSGKAMELLEEEFIDLVQAMRVSYGTLGLVKLYTLLGMASAKLKLSESFSNQDWRSLQLLWPKVYLPSAAEIQEFATALNMAISAKVPLLSPDIAIQLFGIFLDVPHSVLIDKTLEEIVKETLDSRDLIQNNEGNNQDNQNTQNTNDSGGENIVETPNSSST